MPLLIEGRGLIEKTIILRLFKRKIPTGWILQLTDRCQPQTERQEQEIVVDPHSHAVIGRISL